eukprot:CAMPEP_0180195864 /NCGR_PEP_ID=MMETSP0987-20121128/3810_1 /TAXON_ID=697907 /ORGANISM="non described non described, Strain CCMP2293" /LENGTH=47 /DNA_ID= /DNA_START= /DNA_END= /DNA_ORIENTATION=
MLIPAIPSGGDMPAGGSLCRSDASREDADTARSDARAPSRRPPSHAR